MAEIVLKLEGFENLDVEFVVEFLYNLKVYMTALVEIAKDDKEIAYRLEEIKLDRFTGEYDIRKIRDILEEDIRLKYILEKTQHFIKRRKKRNVFHYQTVKLEIIDIRRGSWYIKLLPIVKSKIIFPIAISIATILALDRFVLDLERFVFNRKTVEFVERIASKEIKINIREINIIKIEIKINENKDK